MTCPNDDGKWYKNDKELDEGLTLTLDYDSDTKGSYRCDYKVDETDRTYYFYVKGKACANCVELDASSFGLVIAADMAGTVVLMAIIYKCTKKRSSAGPTPSSKEVTVAMIGNTASRKFFFEIFPGRLAPTSCALRSRNVPRRDGKHSHTHCALIFICCELV
ncbi:hypothetical protein F2P81_017466 [Scophthalmus maximus]|uniref:Uncharacterized protein n=1 Tax=Scophthalmus maximus TaxID=52904 RepID=A0A6A4SE02_SCOMX|nr:hypothetical protein F2P81_017466 [Scophthalmus maximus]